MAYTTVNNIIVALHNGSAPTEEEWANYIKAVKRLDLTKIRAVAFTDGGAPDSKQRKELNEILNSRPSPGVVVSSSTVVRSVVTALTWFNPLVKAFAPDRTAEAWEYLKLTQFEIDAIRTQVRAISLHFSPPLRCVAL